MSNMKTYGLSKDEELIFNLRRLYEQYGYNQYKMGKFEEYDLYAENKDFLVSDGVITFTDTNGKLKALKPDVTLSIVRSSRFDADDMVRKVYYHENVYRISGKNRTYCEIMQTGLECIGDIDEYCVSEVLMLAGQSLKLISDEAVLDVSHMGILAYYMDRLGLEDEHDRLIMKYIGEKNTHELEDLCSDQGADEVAVRELIQLISLSGTMKEVLPELRKLRCPAALIQELDRIESTMSAYGIGDLLRINFSVINDMNYYNGLVFKGYIKGIPDGVLSGGRYDSLMRKMGRKTGAIGFAVYPDQLERLWEKNEEFDVDTVLLYDQYADPEKVTMKVRQLTQSAVSVCALRTVPKDLKYRTMLVFNENEVE